MTYLQLPWFQTAFLPLFQQIKRSFSDLSREFRFSLKPIQNRDLRGLLQQLSRVYSLP